MELSEELEFLRAFVPKLIDFFLHGSRAMLKKQILTRAIKIQRNFRGSQLFFGDITKKKKKCYRCYVF